MKPTRRQRQQRLLVNLRAVMVGLRVTADTIDRIGEDAAEFSNANTGADTDQLACFAANSLQGALSLLRELGAVIAAAPARRRRQ